MSDAAKDSLAARLLRGEPAALAGAITRVETGSPDALELLKIIHPRLGRAGSIGVTGAPGVGKSTLLNSLIHALRARGFKVGVIAVDPSSPISGGAILGDRIRMGDHDLDDGVFIRSLASRGERGGLSVAAARVVDVMDAAGYERIILETVGAGQSELDIAEIADVRVVVCAPGLGDDIQAIKAGVLEVADVLVVNKSDLPKAATTARELRAALALRAGVGAKVPVLETSATRREGIDTLVDAVENVLAERAGTRAERARLRMRRILAKAAALETERRVLAGEAPVDRLCDRVQRGDIALGDAVVRLLDARGNVDE